MRRLSTLNQYVITIRPHHVRPDIIFRWSASERAGQAVESRAVPGAFDRAVRQHFTRGKWHPLVRTFVAQGGHLVSPTNEANSFP